MDLKYLNSDILSAVIISLKISFGALLITVISGTLLSWKMAKVDKIWKRVAEVIITLPIFFPPSAVGYMLLMALGRRGFLGGYIYKYFHWNIIFTLWGGIVATSVVILPIVYQNTKNGFMGLDPMYMEVSRELGLTSWQTLYHVQLPLIKKHIFTGMVLGFGRAIGEFGATLMVAGNIPGRTQTIPMAIYSYVETGNYTSANVILGINCIITLITLLLYNISLRRD